MRFSKHMKDPENEQLERLVKLMQTDESVDAPQDSIQWAKNLYRSRAAEPAPSIIRKIVASLQVDLAPGKAVFGERSAASSAARQMFFSAGDNAVDLRIKARGKRFDVRGQVLGEGFTGGRLDLAGDVFSTEAAIAENGEFQIKGVPAGRYSLAVRSDQKVIIIDELELG